MTDKTIDSRVLKAITEKNADMKRLLDAVEVSDSQKDCLDSFNEALRVSSSASITCKDMADAIEDAIKDLS